MSQVLITSDDLQRQARSFVADWESIAENGVTEDGNEYDSPWQWFNESILSVEVTVGLGTSNVTEVTVVTGIGGPHVEFVLRGYGQAEWRGFWGSDSPTWFDHSPVYEIIFDTLAELHGDVR